MIRGKVESYKKIIKMAKRGGVDRRKENKLDKQCEKREGERDSIPFHCKML